MKEREEEVPQVANIDDEGKEATDETREERTIKKGKGRERRRMKGRKREGKRWFSVKRR